MATPPVVAKASSLVMNFRGNATQKGPGRNSVAVDPGIKREPLAPETSSSSWFRSYNSRDSTADKKFDHLHDSESYSNTIATSMPSVVPEIRSSSQVEYNNIMSTVNSVGSGISEITESDLGAGFSAISISGDEELGL